MAQADRNVYSAGSPAGSTAGPIEEGDGAMRAAARRVLLGILAWAAVSFLTLGSGGPPEVVSAEAPSTEASGERALETLERLARGGLDEGAVSRPRPIGSAANDRCRERILDELRRLGLRPEVQEVFGVNPRHRCAGTVRNIVVRLRGAMRGTQAGGGEAARQSAILCMAHYDSVGAGPGVGDDLAGVAAWIEVARALRERRPLNRDVIFLFEDGEEHGLLGAEVFAAKHPWAAEVGAVVNLEGRGTSGPSRMFETGLANEWIVRAFQKEASSPSTTSLSAEIYRRMPNDTDYTVWRERGVPGLNFAFIGDVSRYHTPLDDLGNLSRRSLQHHVTNGLEAVLALDGATFPNQLGESERRGLSDAVYFTLPGFGLVLTSVRTARVLGIALLIAALLAVVRSIRVGAIRPVRVVLCWVLIALTLVGGHYASAGEIELERLLGVTADAARPAHMGPALVGILAAAVFGWALLAGLLSGLARGAEMGAAVLLLFAGLTSALTWTVPGVSFLLAIPAGVMALGGLLLRTRSDVDARWGRAGVVALTLGAAVLAPLHEGVISAFGVGVPTAAAAPVLMGALLLLPSLMGPGRVAALWLSGIAFLTAALAAVFLSQLDTHTAVQPGHLNLVHVMEEGQASWQLKYWRSAPDGETVELLTAALDDGSVEPATEGLPAAAYWPGSRAARVPAAPVGEEPPSAELLALDGDPELKVETLRFRALPGRSCDQLGLSVPFCRELTIDGVAVPGGMVRLLAPPPEGVEVVATFTGVGRRQLAVQLASQQYGLRGVRGRMADEYLSARPAELVPFGHGDGSEIRAQVVFREAQKKGGDGNAEGEDAR